MAKSVIREIREMDKRARALQSLETQGGKRVVISDADLQQLAQALGARLPDPTETT